jgi:hypothetical protein
LHAEFEPDIPLRREQCAESERILLLDRVGGCF